VLCAAAAGCGRDFDALFTDPSTTNVPSEADSAVTDGGTVEEDATSTEDASDPRCAPPAPPEACVEEIEKDDGEITKTCSGCECPCAPFECENKDGKECSTECSNGTTCQTRCKSDECNLEVNAATGSLTCTDKAKQCVLKCRAGSRCELFCENSGSCTATCDKGSECLVRCPADGGKPDRCNVVCQEGAPQSCPQGITTCNRACP